MNLAETLVADEENGGGGDLAVAPCSRSEPKNPEALGAKGRLLLAARSRRRRRSSRFEQATATSDPEPFIELATRIWRANRVPARATPPPRRFAAAPAIPGRWRCSGAR